MATLHFASGDNLNSQGDFTPAKAGFNLADVQSVDQLNALPDGVQGLIWLDKSDGVTSDFIDAVKPYIGNPKVFGFFLVDEPDPTGQWGKQVSADDLRAESDWIHANVPGAKTFITMMNMGSSDHPDFTNTYNPQNSHIDLYGLDPYPVHSESSTVDYNMIDRTVTAAEASGIPRDQMVPVFQTFGGGGWVNEQGGKYVMPSAEQAQQMLDHWAALVPNPTFDYAYAWGSQNGDQSLESSQELQDVFLHHNASGNAESSVTAPPASESTPVAATDPVTTADPPADPPASTPNDSASTPSSASSAENTTSWTAGEHHHGIDFSHMMVSDPTFSAGHHFGTRISIADPAADRGALSSSHVFDGNEPSYYGFDPGGIHGSEHGGHHWSWHM